MANIFAASKEARKKKKKATDDGVCSAISKKDLTSGVDDDDNDDDTSSDGFLLIDEKNDVHVQDGDDGLSDGDVESFSSWNQVDELSPPSTPHTTTITTTTSATLTTAAATTTTSSRGEQQIRSSLNYDGYMEVDDDDKFDKSGNKDDISKNEKTSDNHNEKTTPPTTVIFDSNLNKEGYMEVCLLQKEEEGEVQDTNNKDEGSSDPIVVLEGVLMLGKNNAHGGCIFFLVRIVLLTVICRLMLALCSKVHGGGAIPPQTFLAGNATSSSSSSNSHILHTTSCDPWLDIMPLPTETVMSRQAHGDDTNNASSLYINGSIILAPRPIKNNEKESQCLLYPFWISQQEQQEATTLDVYLLQLLEKKQNIPHVATFQQLTFIDIVDDNHNDDDDKANFFCKSNNISAWFNSNPHHDSATDGAVGFPAAKIIDATGKELTSDALYYNVELLSAKGHHVGTLIKEKAAFAAMAEEGSKNSLFKQALSRPF